MAIPQDNGSADVESDSEENRPTSGLGAKVSRQDSLARFLERRPLREAQQVKKMFASKSHEVRAKERSQIEHRLERQLSQRPTQTELQEKNILLRKFF